MGSIPADSSHHGFRSALQHIPVGRMSGSSTTVETVVSPIYETDAGDSRARPRGDTHGSHYASGGSTAG